MSQPHVRIVRKNRRPVWVVVGIAAVAAVILGIVFLPRLLGGGPAGASAASVDSAGQTPQSGGTLTYLDAEVIASASIQNGTWQSTALTHNITDRLVFANPDTGELEPWLAESWDISEDGLEYVFRIRDGVTFSNGQELDAGAVQRNIEFQAFGNPDLGVVPNTTYPIVDTVTSDETERTVTVRLVEPFSPYIKILSNWASSLVADETLALSAEELQQATNVIGTGPFVVESEVYGEEIVLVRRDDYAWAPAGSENQGAAYLEKIIWIPVLEDSTRLGSLRAGEGDLIRYVQPSEEDALAADGFQVLGLQGTGQTNTWILKQQIPALRDVRVRQAISAAIDRDQIIDDLYTDNWTTASSLVTEDAFGFTDQSDKLEFDRDRADALLDEAGWTERDAEGYRVKDGERLHIKTVIDVFDATSAPLFQLIAWQLQQVGIELELTEVDYANVSTAYADPEVGVLRTGWPQADPWVTIRNAFDTEKTNTLALPETDEVLNDLLNRQTTVDGDERAEILAELQDYLIDNAYAFPILTDTQVFALQPHVRGFEWTPEARPVFHNTWIAED
ncbi:peptide/nickel transport system substrate-binding protein [Microbacterium ginsengiterrae]|uniref:Peptide/nickel transport system substrate-binding protein n=1 Tax=Microbacterium ginsengiterrae TaxID=546115 RepID=A0A7W9CCC8_9MICO|nr:MULTISPECIES: ABC transporter substrate-binding protein [Microbacterium]MBB5742999.1 peptide/nickel transport system substrate-binding protein [Microbacterium ginsengiterrae]